MKRAQAALYARVSSEAQASAQTIQSQLAALQTRIAAAGDELSVEQQFIDEGYSGSTLVRPPLDARGGVYPHRQDVLGSHERVG